jgi:uncharacterized protein (DUF2384 family)
MVNTQPTSSLGQERFSIEGLETLIPVVAHALATFGDEKKATHWLSTPLQILEGATPFQVMSKQGGAELIETILTRIEHSIPS